MDAQKVLIVDDDPDVREALDGCLRDEGFEVHSAEHGQAALDKLMFGLRPAVILLDLMMPIMNGFETLEVLHSSRKWNDIPVIIVSANQGYDADDFKGVFRIIRKPVDLEPLCDAIKLAIAG